MAYAAPTTPAPLSPSSTTSCRLQQQPHRRITALTQKGVASLQHKRYANALLYFRHAIECTKQLGDQRQLENLPLESLEQDCDYISDDEEDDYECDLVRVPLCVAGDLEMTAEEDEYSPNAAANVPRHARSPHNVFDIYACAYVLNAPKFVSRVKVSAILFYNIALTHHLAGINGFPNTEPFNNDRHLQDSLRYYKICMTIVRSHTSDPATSSLSCSWHGLVLGVLNNMGFLFYHFFQIKEAQACMFHMDKVLQSAATAAAAETTSSNAENHNAAASSSTEYDETFDFFFTTLTHAKNLHTRVAPAA